MTRDEMLKEMEVLRAQGHTMGIQGHAGEWMCEFDNKRGYGKTPMDAFVAARDLALEKPHV